MIKIMGYLTKKDWGYIFLSIFLIVMQVWLDLKLPDNMSDITMLVQTEGSEMQDVLMAGGYMLACTLGSLVLTFTVGYFVARIAIGVTKRLREIIHDKLMDLSMENSGKLSLSGLITRSTNGCYPISKFCSNGVTAICKSANFGCLGSCENC
ncbi:ABC transporter ATP-binding protein [Listeria monocytogenes]|jgi:ATP-binding cassette subfamily B protein|uniref:ABC transporter transmembrane domain-containing protein n=1 Tax=Bacilli TaxID=91061 RepID=UPI000E6CF432|nr:MULTISPECIES: ABC transporter transmembrane domain-containing protein [Bacilli]EAE2482130.1 ABC transporter ATP-binding protein [Listeria innocua]EME7221960.1 ABC transporter ATP-binding protein [Enterococcus faecium]EAF5010709.1 ABC transporter ATP-binding protein [Listeria innocua]EAF5053462.1 ABC transporter ATP-binding protein [Listeria monocytogenes]EAH3830657.1 ABC transporter ATP-binding protein [Listeria monocytogenes]